MDFDALWRVNYPAIKLVARCVAGGQEDAEDLVSNTMLRAFQTLSSYDRETPFFHWASRIMDLCWSEMTTARSFEPETMSFSEITPQDLRCNLRR